MRLVGVKMIRVMLVEDEINTLKLLKLIVNWEEFHMKIVGEAQNGQEALFKISNVQPDMIITDIKMPVMDGIELAREIEKRFPEIKVMIITAYDDIKFAQQALRSGVVDYILKPIKRQEVKEALKRIQGQIEKNCVEQSGNLMEKVREYLEEHYAESELSLTTVAERFYLNPSYLSRAFRKKHNVTLVEYLNNIRIEQACMFLRESDWKIYQIAERVGIPNPDYFGRCFKKKMGISVKEFRMGKNCEEMSKNI